MKKLQLIFILVSILTSSSLWAQDKVQGIVTDESGEPLIGVSVVIQGTSTGTITNIDGGYAINVAGPEVVLEFSYIGYKNQSEKIGNRSQIDIALIEDIEQLDEIVVSALGFKQKKDNLGSTYSTISNEDMVRSGETGVINGLAGKASGVRIARSNGDPGAGSTIQIRGQNTITGSANPLIIVDGVPLNNETVYGGGNEISGGNDAGTSQQSRLNDINPNDIATMQVLKGASAASLWGSRAANGVIVITTKSGKSGKPRITYTTTYSSDKINKRHPLQTKYGQGDNNAYDPADSDSWGDKISDRSGGADEVDQTGQFYEALDGSLYYPILTKNSRDVFSNQNFDQVFQTGHFLQHDLSISGGSEKSTFFFSAGLLEQEGIIKNSFYDRKNLRLNNTTQLADWINISTKTAYTFTNSNRIQQSSNVSGLYLGLLRTAPDFDNSDYIGTYHSASGETFDRRHRSYRRYLGNNFNPTYNNPNWTINEQKATSKVHRFLVTEEVNIDANDWLAFKIRGGIDYYSDTREYFFPVGSAGSNRRNGTFAQDGIRNLELNFDAIARANFELSSDIGLETTVGWSINDITRRVDEMLIREFTVNTTFATFNNAGDELSHLERNLRNRRSNRGYALAGLNIKDQVFFNASGAIEAASSIDETFFYPSLDAAWKFTELESFNNESILSFGKLRASWGKVGVQPRPHRGQTLTDAGFSVSSFSDNLDVDNFGGGFRLDDDKGNSDLKPEVKTEVELGMDLRLFKDKLGINFTYYKNEIKDLLFDVTLPTSTGFVNEYTNAGTMENKGIEIDLNYKAFDREDFGLNFYTNFNKNDNLVTDLKGTESVDLTTQSVSSRAVEGYALGAIWGTHSLKDDDGNMILDANGFPQSDASNPGVLGDPNPDWRGGLGANLRWKGFRFNVLFEHSQGGDFINRTKIVLYRFGTHADVGNEVTLTQDLKNVADDTFTAGTTVRGNIADFGGGAVLLDEKWYTGIGGGFGSGVLYDLYVDDATWTRLREMSISYTLDKDWLNTKLGLSSVEFTATGRNLALWTDVKGIDPEVNQFGVGNGFGIDYFTNPSTKSFLFSIKVTY